jgi:hypothetical protein
MYCGKLYLIITFSMAIPFSMHEIYDVRLLAAQFEEISKINVSIFEQLNLNIYVRSEVRILSQPWKYTCTRFLKM